MLIQNIEDLDSLIRKIVKNSNPSQPIAIDTETTDLNPFKAELVGIGICWGSGTNDLAYIPIGHNISNNYNQIPLEEVINKLSPWLSDKRKPKVLQNAKYDRLIFLRHGLTLKGVILDTMLADYIIDPNRKHSLDEIAKREFGFTPQGFSDLVKKGETFAEVDILSASLYCGMDVYLTRKIGILLTEELEQESPKLLNLLKEIEQPLEPVLAQMEATGIRIDVPYLKKLSAEIQERLMKVEKNVHNISGQLFNLASPKQLGEILFETLQLDRKKSRRTKTGWSTDVNVLERLESDHEIIPLIIEHRVLSKLLSTYVDALPQLVEEETKRVHTDFNQAVTATGRLSSSNPNLQNIPIRTEFSRQIRKAFLPKENWSLLSADYSQIELRILAHLSGEESLQETYKKKGDVHAMTAKILLEKESISLDERRLGKTINFGVIYGMGAQRLSRSTGISQAEAKHFLNRYKERYPKIFAFLELQERLALTQGYVTTIFGRRRPFKFNPNGLGRLLGKDPFEIDLNLARRGGLEAQQLRAAANAPIQGSSADIIKIAMVELQRKIDEENLPAHLLLQVHDELVLETDIHALNHIKNIVVNTMENAVSLSVPLLVETGVGDNWMEAK